MATETQARKARTLYSKQLVKRGAHAVGVEPGSKHGHPGFVIVAYIKRLRKALPHSLSLPAAEGGKEVPVVVKQASEFKLQSLK